VDKPHPPWTAALLGAAVLGMLALAVVGVAWHAQGGRWFTTTSPSMGEELPVGTFLTTRASTVAQTRVGDVVTFRSPGSGAVFTHRVVGKDTSGLETRGDVNGVPDAWRITDAQLVGAVAWHVPVLGWVVRALPLLLVGLGVVWLLTRRLRAGRRRSWRLLGASVVTGVVGWWLSPWVGLARLGQQAAPEGEKGVLMEVISTGLLPIKAHEVDGPAWAHLRNGQTGDLHLTTGADRGAFDVGAALDLPWWGWVVLVLLLLTPLWWSLVTDYRSQAAASQPESGAHRANRSPETVGAVS